MENNCELCEREGVKTTVHHLVPREMGGNFGPTAHLCIPCHKQIHGLFTNDELALYLNSISSLRRNEKLAKFIKWIKKQPATKLPTVKKSNRRKQKK